MVGYFSQKDEKDTGKTLFSINNIQVENGTIRADDEVRNKHLLVDDMNISLPFIANRSVCLAFSFIISRQPASSSWI